MIPEPNSALRSASPASSNDLSSPTNSTRKSRDDESTFFRKDKNYRRYASGVERALTLFDTALQEWADYISFLGRLLKALQARPANITIVPSKVTVAKRLAQCLDPTLPSGVHQKAIEVYGYIFSFIGGDGLGRDLRLFLPGLSSVLSFASLSVRPLFLSLFETYVLPLDPPYLRPSLKAAILALLPGLEEETSEDFDRTLQLLDGFRVAFAKIERSQEKGYDYPDVAYFWQCLFLAAVTSPNRRLGALAYLSRYLPRLGPRHRKTSSVADGSDSSQQLPPEEAVISPEPGLFIRCFAAGLGDDQLLIQRGFLDLLVTHLPLHCDVLQSKVSQDDKEKLVAAAAGVVVRRDMSLNRRLWSWFLGPDNFAPGASAGGSTAEDGSDGASKSSFNVQAEYFRNYGLEPLTNSILSMISRNASSSTERAKPFRICLSLMDRWEIGGQIVPKVFLPLISDVQNYRDSAANKDAFAELFRSASVFFDGVESGLIWSAIFSLLYGAFDETADNSAAESMRKLNLAEFIISEFNIREEEMLVAHIPLALLALLTLTFRYNSLRNEPDVSKAGFRIVHRLAELIPDRAFTVAADSPGVAPNAQDHENQQTALSNGEILKSIDTFYRRSQGSLAETGLPFPTKDIGFYMLRISASIAIAAMTSEIFATSPDTGMKVFNVLIHKIPECDTIKEQGIVSALIDALEPGAISSGSALSFRDISSLCSGTLALYSARKPGFYMSYKELCHLVVLIVRNLWPYLSPSRPEHHVESVRCLWQLQNLTAKDRIIEATIATLMTEDMLAQTSRQLSVESAKKFTILWNHSNQLGAGANPSTPLNISEAPQDPFKGSGIDILIRPLFLILDSTRRDRNETSVFVKAWLQNLSSISKVFEVLMLRLQSFSICRNPQKSTLENVEKAFLQSQEDLGECRYYFETVNFVLQSMLAYGWESFASVNRAPIQDPKLPAIVEKRDGPETGDAEEGPLSFQILAVRFCINIVACGSHKQNYESTTELAQLQVVALQTLQQILQGPSASLLTGLSLENSLIDLLSSSLDHSSSLVQIPLINVTLSALHLRSNDAFYSRPPSHKRRDSKDTVRSSRRESLALTERSEKDSTSSQLLQPPPNLFECLTKGLTSEASRPILDVWIEFVVQCIPLYNQVIFQVLLPLVSCFCKQIRGMFKKLQARFELLDYVDDIAPEAALLALLTGLEQVLATSHDRLVTVQGEEIVSKIPEQPQTFLGSMVSGVFAVENHQTRRSNANNRLTVLLCFQDTIKICFEIWSWGSYVNADGYSDPALAASFNYTSLRVRNRTRRILDHLFSAEALEALETLVTIWCNIDWERPQDGEKAIMNLLQVLDSSRPKTTLPAIFNAIYSRTNPNALDPLRKSSLTSDISSVELVAFLVEYAKSVDDDAVDEIWNDCMTFFRDVLNNPFPQRQTLPRLLEFSAVLAAKLENTNFGDQHKMRRELGDVFLRLLTAIFTIKPGGLSDINQSSRGDTSDKSGSSSPSIRNPRRRLGSDGIATILAELVPNLSLILPEPDRMATVVTQISTNVISPAIHARSFPENMNESLLNLLFQLTRAQNTSKSWKKDVSDAFNDTKFFRASVEIIKSFWLDILRQWIVADKDRFLELLSRISPPTSAGIMFGVGAATARLEADRRTQLNLRRISVLLLSVPEDSFAGSSHVMKEKLVDLLAATRASSPSSATRAELFMLLRALTLKTSPAHLAAFWPIIDDELRNVFEAMFSQESSELYNEDSLLQAAKLLDMLLVIAPDDFQLYEWLFITDTIDAVYRPKDWKPVAVIDELADEIGNSRIPSGFGTNIFPQGDGKDGRRRPLLSSEAVRKLGNEDIINKVLRPFFIQLSIYSFESTYKMGVPDRTACVDDLLADLFNETTLVS